VISIDHLPRITPLFMALSQAISERITATLFYWHRTAGLAAGLSRLMPREDEK
jgi:hypothetical protein